MQNQQVNGGQQPIVPWYQQQQQQQNQQQHQQSQWYTGNSNAGTGYPLPPPQQQQQQQQHQPYTSYPPPHLQHHQGPGPAPPGTYYPQQQQQHLAPPPQQQHYQHQQQQQAPPPSAPAPPAVPLAPPMCTMYATLTLPRSTGRNSAATTAGPTSTAAAAAAAAKSSSGKPVAPMLEVQMGYHECADTALRRLGGGTWDSRRRVWIFPLSSHDKVLEALRNATGVKVKVEPLHHLPAAVLKSASTIPDDSSRYCHIPTTLEEQLMEFQREGVKFGLVHGGRVLIGDEMGLGKERNSNLLGCVV